MAWPVPVSAEVVPTDSAGCPACEGTGRGCGCGRMAARDERTMRWVRLSCGGAEMPASG